MIPNESPVLTRDYLSGVYPIPIYYFGVLFFYTIEVFINMTIIFHIIYWMVFHGTLINEETAYPWVYVTMLLHSLVGIAVGMLISSIATSFSMAFSLANAFQTVLMLYSGFLILDGEIPDACRIFQYLSSWYYTLNVNMHLVYEDVPPPCERPPFDHATLEKLEKELFRPKPDDETVNSSESRIRKCACRPGPPAARSRNFLVATKRLYMRVCPSVRWSDGPLVGNQLFFRPTRSDECRVYGLVFLLLCLTYT